jgi:hypothetical protein
MDVDCPNCFDSLTGIEAKADVVQFTSCRECRRFYSVVVGVEIKEEAPPDWREVEGDLRFHENR